MMTTHAFVGPFNETTEREGKTELGIKEKEGCRSAAIRLKSEGGEDIDETELCSELRSQQIAEDTTKPRKVEIVINEHTNNAQSKANKEIAHQENRERSQTKNPPWDVSRELAAKKHVLPTELPDVGRSRRHR